MERDWVWYADRSSLDLVNTVRDRKTGGRELLIEPADLRDWLRQAEFDGISARTSVTENHLAAATRLRDAINAATEAVLADGHIRQRDLTTINRWATTATRLTYRLRQPAEHAPTAEPTGPGDPVEAALATIAADAVQLLGTSERDTIRVCSAHDCGLRFTDRSPAGRRQWCSMERCGNRAKARAHRARRRTTES